MKTFGNIQKGDIVAVIDTMHNTVERAVVDKVTEFDDDKVAVSVDYGGWLLGSTGLRDNKFFEISEYGKITLIIVDYEICAVAEVLFSLQKETIDAYHGILQQQENKIAELENRIEVMKYNDLGNPHYNIMN